MSGPLTEVDPNATSASAYVSGGIYGARRPMDVLTHDANGLPTDLIYSFMRNTASSRELNIDASTSGGLAFFWNNNTTTAAHILRFNIMLVDGTMEPQNFGAISGGLSTGVSFTINDTNGTVLLDLCDGELIKKNCEFANCAGTDIDLYAGSGDDSLTIKWGLHDAGAVPLLKKDQSLRIKLQDDLTALTNFRVMVQGHYLPTDMRT